MPSLDLLLQTVMGEHDKQLAQFNAMDTRAGIFLAFDGVLIALARPIPVEFQVPGIVLAAASAAFALWAFVPGAFTALNPARMRKYLTYQADDTRLVLHDTISAMIEHDGRVLAKKGSRQKIALALLLVAAVTLGAGLIFSATTTSGSTQQVNKGLRTPVGTPSPSASG